MTRHILRVLCIKSHFYAVRKKNKISRALSWFWLTSNNVGKPCSWSQGAPAMKRTSTLNMDNRWRNTCHYGNGNEIVWDCIPPCLAIAVPQKAFLQPAATIWQRCCFLDFVHDDMPPTIHSIDWPSSNGRLTFAWYPNHHLPWSSLHEQDDKWMRQVWCLSRKQYRIHTPSDVSATEQNPSPPHHIPYCSYLVALLLFCCCLDLPVVIIIVAGRLVELSRDRMCRRRNKTHHLPTIFANIN